MITSLWRLRQDALFQKPQAFSDPFLSENGSLVDSLRYWGSRQGTKALVPDWISLRGVSRAYRWFGTPLTSLDYIR